MNEIDNAFCPNKDCKDYGLQIYLTNLSQYNNGFLIGEWLELPNTKDELQDAMRRVLNQDEEYFITDTEGIPFEVSEFDDLYGLNDKLYEYEALYCHEQLGVSFLLSEGFDWNYSLENREDVIMYLDESLEDVAYSLVEDGCFGTVGDGLVNYIDYSSIAKDLSYDGYVQTDQGVFHYAG